jgi:hypothetical protein
VPNSKTWARRRSTASSISTLTQICTIYQTLHFNSTHLGSLVTDSWELLAERMKVHLLIGEIGLNGNRGTQADLQINLPRLGNIQGRSFDVLTADELDTTNSWPLRPDTKKYQGSYQLTPLGFMHSSRHLRANIGYNSS